MELPKVLDKSKTRVNILTSKSNPLFIEFKPSVSSNRISVPVSAPF
jgi:hypothetical protein